MTRSSLRRLVAVVGALVLLSGAACNGGGTPDEVELGIGVTEEPCPDAVNEDNGCIYLGVLSDLSVGPFAAFGPQLLAGEQAFWKRVNEAGGIGGEFDVDVGEFVLDTEYNPEKHATSYLQLRDEVLALSETLGTPPTLAIIDSMIEDDMVGAVSTWWSGWAFQDNILEAGSNYCVDAMNGIEWAVGEYDVGSVMSVAFPGDYGGDAAAGVGHAAEALDLEHMDPVQQVPVAAGGKTAGTVQTILDQKPDLVVLTTGPTEAGEIIGGTVARGFEGRFIGNHPTYYPTLMASEAAPAIEASYHVIGPYQNWGGDSAAHDAMREAFGEGAPDNDGFTFGWVLSYPMKAALEAAAAAGQLNREGVLAAVDGLAVDFEGALPSVTYGEPDQTVVRQTTISQPDADVVEDKLGLNVIEPAYTGTVAEGFEFTGACFEIET